MAANRIDIGPPSEPPISTARRDPTASITARTSSIRVSRSGCSRDPVDEAGAALVEQDEPAKRAEAG